MIILSNLKNSKDEYNKMHFNQSRFYFAKILNSELMYKIWPTWVRKTKKIYKRRRRLISFPLLLILFDIILSKKKINK